MLTIRNIYMLSIYIFKCLNVLTGIDYIFIYISTKPFLYVYTFFTLDIQAGILVVLVKLILT